MSAYYSQLAQNCDEHVKVMTEVDSASGKIVGIESVTLPVGASSLACPLKKFVGNKMECLKIEGSSVNCLMDCVHRMPERV